VLQTYNIVLLVLYIKDCETNNEFITVTVTYISHGPVA